MHSAKILSDENHQNCMEKDEVKHPGVSSPLSSFCKIDVETSLNQSALSFYESIYDKYIEDFGIKTDRRFKLSNIIVGICNRIGILN